MNGSLESSRVESSRRGSARFLFLRITSILCAHGSFTYTRHTVGTVPKTRHPMQAGPEHHLLWYTYRPRGASTMVQHRVGKQAVFEPIPIPNAQRPAAIRPGRQRRGPRAQQQLKLQLPLKSCSCHCRCAKYISIILIAGLLVMPSCNTQVPYDMQSSLASSAVTLLIFVLFEWPVRYNFYIFSVL